MGFINFKNRRILQKRTLPLTLLSQSDLIAEKSAVMSYCCGKVPWLEIVGGAISVQIYRKIDLIGVRSIFLIFWTEMGGAFSVLIIRKIVLIEKKGFFF